MAAGTYRLALIASVGVLTCAQTSRTNSSLAPRITARELQTRQEPSFVPAHIGQRVSVHGIVATKAINFGEYAHLPVRGDDTKGVLLERPRGGLDEFLPGDVVEATGIVSHRAGAPVLVLDGIVKKGHREPPEPLRVEDHRPEPIREYRQLHHVRRVRSHPGPECGRRRSGGRGRRQFAFGLLSALYEKRGHPRIQTGRQVTHHRDCFPVLSSRAVRPRIPTAG